jgi:ABC-type iron transport system FetAB ATPase subunit
VASSGPREEQTFTFSNQKKKPRILILEMHYTKEEVSNDRKIENLVFHFVGSRATRKQMAKMSQCGEK